jgi:hypothetical protein
MEGCISYLAPYEGYPMPHEARADRDASGGSLDSLTGTQGCRTLVLPLLRLVACSWLRLADRTTQQATQAALTRLRLSTSARPEEYGAASPFLATDGVRTAVRSPHRRAGMPRLSDLAATLTGWTLQASSPS